MHTTTHIDDLVGLDLVAAMTPARLRHFQAQLSINGIPRPVIPSGLAHLLHLPGDPEPRTLTRARMAAEIERCVSAHGCVTRENLEAAGFTGAEIAELFTEARRIARVERMVA